MAFFDSTDARDSFEDFILENKFEGLSGKRPGAECKLAFSIFIQGVDFRLPQYSDELALDKIGEGAGQYKIPTIASKNQINN